MDVDYLDDVLAIYRGCYIFQKKNEKMVEIIDLS